MNPSGLNANDSVADRLSGTLLFRYVQHYGLAVVSVGAALGVSLLLQHFGFRVPSELLLLLAVAISSWYGGPGPAVLALVMSMISFYWYFIEPVRTIYIYRSDIPLFIIFAGFALLLSWFGTVRRRAEASLRERAALLNLTHDTVFVMDMDGLIRYWNRGAEERYGWTADQAAGRVVHEMLKTVFPAPLDEIKAEVTRAGRWEGELLHTRKDGSQLVAASRWSLERSKRGEPVAILETNNDITDRKRAEDALRRSNRELRALSNCNQSLMRASDERSLLDRICQIVCEEAGYRMAWVGYAEHDEAKSVRPAAWSGAEEGYLATAALTWAETERGRGPTGTAIRSGKTCCIEDFATDLRLVPWREALLQRGFRSAIALPLKDENDKAFGSLTIYSAHPNAFPPEEVRLLEELAGDLAFGIVTLRSQAARKKAEQALRQSEAYLAEAQRLSRTGSWALDAATREYTYWSDEMYRIFGVDPRGGIPMREVMGRQIHPEDASRATAGFEKSLREKVDTSDEYRFLLPDGTVKHIQSIRHPALNDAGDVVQLVGTFVDITERKAAEEALRESEMRFRTFVDHAADALCVLDEQRRIIDANREACQSAGYTREELIGKVPHDFDPDVDAAMLQRIDDQIATGEVCTFETRNRRKDGKLFPVEVRVRGFQHGGQRLHLVLVRDISERKQAEKEREKLRQLEADLAHINRVSMMGELTASIAHEVNQPLSGVVSNASACLRWLAGETPNLEEARDTARRIVRDGKRAAEVVARVRAMTKRTEAPREKLNLNETIREVLALVGDEAKKNSVVIRTGFSDDVGPVLVDRVQLQQVLLNLVMNGIEAMSSIEEHARQLAITTRNTDSDQVQVTVQDSGRGLDPNTMPKIFDPFYTTKPHGMGMGLSICRSILQAHGGQLWAAANDGPGTSFHFVLPRCEEKSHAAA